MPFPAADVSVPLGAVGPMTCRVSCPVLPSRPLQELQSSGELKELQEESDVLSKRLVKETSALKAAQADLEAERRQAQALDKALQELDQAGVQARVLAAQQARDGARAEADRAAAAAEAAERELAGAKAGDGRDESNKSIQERLEDARNGAKAADSEAKAAQIRIKHCDKELAAARKAVGSLEKEAADLERKLQAERWGRELVLGRMRPSGGALFPGLARCLRTSILPPSCAVGLRWPSASAGLPPCSRTARAPSSWRPSAMARPQACARPATGWTTSRPSWPRSTSATRPPTATLTTPRSREWCVPLPAVPAPPLPAAPPTGLARDAQVAKLVRVRDTSAATALEVVAGAKLYNVVVDTEETAKALLSRGQLRQRVTIIPLNKIDSRVCPDGAVRAAQQLTGGKATLALELVGFEDEVQSAMRYTFGSSFVCPDAATARKLAFSDEVRTRTVTLEGDDFNPGGLLTGGSRSGGASVLRKLHEAQQAEQEVQQLEASLQQASSPRAHVCYGCCMLTSPLPPCAAQLEGRLKALQKGAAEFRKLQQELDLKRHSLALLEGKVQQSESHQRIEAVTRLEEQLAEAQAALEAAQQRRTDLTERAKELEHEIANWDRIRAQRVKESEAKLKKAKEAATSARAAFRDLEQALVVAAAEAEAAAGERESTGAELAKCLDSVAKMEQDIEALKARVAETKMVGSRLPACVQSHRVA